MKRLNRFLARLYPRRWRRRYGMEFDTLLEDANTNWRDTAGLLKGAVLMHIRMPGMSAAVAACSVAGLLAGFILTFVLPPIYRSETRMGIVNAGGGAHQLVLETAQRALSRNELRRIIEEINLYQDDRQRLPMEDVIEIMRRHIRIGRISDSAFHIEFLSGEEGRSRQAVQRLTRSFLDENGKRPAGSGGFAVLDNGTTQPLRRYQGALPLSGAAAGALFGLLWAFRKRLNRARS